jgi:hypothetical protein
MFGYAVTSGTLVAHGTYGAIVRFNISNLEPRQVTQVQLQLTEGTDRLSLPQPSSVGQATLSAYPEDASCPDFAWCQNGDMLDVFLKISIYPMNHYTRMGIWFYRNCVNLLSATNKLDVPQESKDMALAMAVKSAYLLKGKNVPAGIDEQINAEQTRLGL